MSNIDQWLTELGLNRYVSVFSEAEIDMGTLPDLIEEDLKELGLPLGPRRKIWKAIQHLNGFAIGTPQRAPDPNPSRGPSPAPIPAPPPKLAPASEAERRHLTVMFVDLVGSTQMATELDPEDMRNVITDYQNTIARIVTRYDGFVAKFMGDGVLCYFGWPQANEDDAERAVRAGLDMIKAVTKKTGPGGTHLSTRVGIASGIVIVGDLIGKDATQEAAVVGETPNLAARLQGLAQPDQLVLPRETLNLLGTVFDLEPLGAHTLKGISDPVEAFSVIGESTEQSRFDAHHRGSLSPIIGREREIDLMLECWDKARIGNGQLILVNGEAGIGKSRITRAVIDRIGLCDHIRLTYQCSPYHTESAFYPTIQQLTYASGITAEDDTNARLDKLEALIQSTEKTTALIAALLGIDATGRYGPLDLTPAQQRTQTMALLVQLLIKLAEDNPVLLVFEDLHWIDPTSLELLEFFLDAIGDHKILILATARPTFKYGFGGHPIMSHFSLNRLGADQIHRVVDKLTGGKHLAKEVIDLIVKRTDGIPLFVEELTKTVLESGVLTEEGDTLLLKGSFDVVAIPNTLHDSLMARLDRLQPIKDVAQTAACIGREFDHRLLANICASKDAELTTALEGLMKAELIYRRGLPPDATYLFKHALVRDAAYESLLKEHRRNIHQRILTALEALPDTIPEVIAHHAETAGLTERAIDLWEAASKIAIARPAFDEGISHLERAYTLIEPQIEKGDRFVVEHAMSLQVQLGVTFMARKGWGADETQAAFKRALHLANEIGETPMRFSILYGLMTGRYLRGEHREAVRHGETFVQLAETATETAPAVVANRSYGISLQLVGRLTEGQSYLERAHALFDPDLHKGLEIQYGQDLGVGSNGFIAFNLALQGETQRAEKHMRDALRYAHASNHANSICYMHLVLSMVGLLLKDEEQLAHHAAAMAALSNEHTLVWFGHISAIFKALITAEQGDPEGIPQYRHADAAVIATKSKMLITWFRIEAGHRALTLGLSDQANDLATQAQVLIEETAEGFARAELHRLEGALALDAGDRSKAKECLQKSYDVANKQSARLLQLRAATDLLRLGRTTGETKEAFALLKSAYDNIEEGNCVKDCRIAHTLLSTGKRVGTKFWG